MNIGLIDILVTLAFIFSGIATVGSFIGIIIYAIKGKNKKPFLIGLVANLIIFAATTSYILEHSPNKTPAPPINQQSSSKTIEDKNKDKHDDHDDDKYDDDKYDHDDDDDYDDKHDDDKYHQNKPQQNNSQRNTNQLNSAIGPNGETIKGNINSKGEKIYHLSGGKYYDKTVPEQWFFSEQDAINAGYRPAKK